MGNRKPYYFVFVSPKVRASLRARRFPVLSLCSPPLSDLGISLQFPFGCFLTSTMTGHRGTSSDPENHVCCTQAGKRSHLVWYGCICTASVPELADFLSGCGAAWVEAVCGCPPLQDGSHLPLPLQPHGMAAEGLGTPPKLWKEKEGATQVRSRNISTSSHTHTTVSPWSYMWKIPLTCRMSGQCSNSADTSLCFQRFPEPCTPFLGPSTPQLSIHY